MALPVGQISLSEVNVELGQPATQLITMNDSAVRTLAGVGGPGTTISMSDLQGKSSRVSIPLTISASVNNYNVYTNRGPTYSAGTSDITLTINPGVFVGSTTTPAAALSVPNQFSPTDTITIINQGVVIGRGGAGGSAPGGPGGAGGLAFLTQRAVTIQNQGTFAGGGGGGGGGISGVIPGPPKGSPTPRIGGGGGGGAGVQGGTAGAPNGSIGTDSTGGAGGAAQGSPATPGGPGGGRGLAGTAAPVGGSGGAAGFYANGNPNITWQQTGTRQGQVS